MAYFCNDKLIRHIILKHNILYWIRNGRAYALPQSVLPAMVALFAAGTMDNFSIGYGLLAIIGVIFAHLSMNLFDDYFDFQTRGIEIRNEMEQNGQRARIAKSPYLVNGDATPKELFIVASLFSAFALTMGVIIVLKQGIVCLYLAFAAGFLGYFYSGKPLRLSYHGFGELIIGIVFGPLLMCGVFYAACGQFTTNILWISCALGLLVINILFTHSILDKEADLKNGKRTLAAVLQRPALNLAASALFNFTPYLLILLSVLLKITSPIFLIVLIILPLSASLYYLIVQFVKNPSKEFKKRWWMEPIEHWKAIEQQGLGWFAIRWFMSRNIMQWFSFILIICFLVSK